VKTTEAFAKNWTGAQQLGSVLFNCWDTWFPPARQGPVKEQEPGDRTGLMLTFSGVGL